MEQKFLDSDAILKGVDRGLKKYKKLNFLEKCGMFLGVSQLLEISLKNLLVEKYNYDFDKLEKWTLGMTSKELKKCGLRPDLFIFLEPVIKYRNYIAHEILANKILYESMISKKGSVGIYPKDERYLDKAIIELEQLMFIVAWTNENDGW